jgi:hypothetical protein
MVAANTATCGKCKGRGTECDHEMATCRACAGTTVYRPTKKCPKCVDGKHRTTITKKLVTCRSDMGGCGGSGRVPAGQPKTCDCVKMAGPPGKRWTAVNHRTCTACAGAKVYRRGSLPIGKILSDDQLAALELVKG